MYEIVTGVTITHVGEVVAGVEAWWSVFCYRLNESS
jgi:hypothetical protein